MTSTGPAPSAGLVAVTFVSLLIVYDVAGTEPNFTAEAPVKPEPVMMTVVPPAVDPESGVMEAITGPD